ncbi:hypothetical protein VNO77_43465 [Canavalia gladiata]|uniref:Late embryogenesis abundant protein LEA-2 subgroup domain-containing protein n=1 Tax=Canavalia gladiata TaxID=3824 RepID=A0AAN9JXU1_CANGL
MIQLIIFIQAHFVSYIVVILLFQYHWICKVGERQRSRRRWCRIRRSIVVGSRRRRVAFKMPPSNDISSSIETLDKGRHRPCCLTCCIWSCIAMFILTIAILFISISYLAFLKEGMPKVYVKTFNITKLEFDDNSQKLNSVINLGLKFSNNDEKLKLLYGPLSIDVSSEDVPLGKTKLNGFSQKPMNDTILDMTMTLVNADVNKYAMDDLKSDIKSNEMVLNVYGGGKIGIQVGSLEMNNVPFLVSCQRIKRMDVDFGRRPQCDVKLFASRSKTQKLQFPCGYYYSPQLSKRRYANIESEHGTF